MSAGSSLLALKAAIVDELDLRLGEVVTVKPHAGVFARTDIERLATLAPSVRVALESLSQEGSSGFINPAVTFQFFICTKAMIDESTGKRVECEDAAIRLMELIVQIAHAQCWKGLASSPSAIQASSLSNDKTDDNAHALWLMSITMPSSIEARDEIGTTAKGLGYRRLTGDPAELVPLNTLATEIKDNEPFQSYDPKLEAITELDE